MSYGDELTLHFGDLRLSDSKKLKDRRYGTYILGFRGSPWILKSGSQPVILGSWFGVQHLEVDTHARAMTKADIENGSLVEVGGRVIAASPYVWKTTGAVGVHIVLSDGLVMDAIPTPPDAEDDDPSPPLASWEILGPHGLLKVGPGVKWEIIPTIKKTA